jgi:hypothetical protein
MSYEMHGREKRSGKPILERERKIGLRQVNFRLAHDTTTTGNWPEDR